MKKHAADMLADKLTNYLAGIPKIKEAWFSLEPAERDAIEEHISEMILKETEGETP